ncbi:MAG: TonB-dependent receptor plug domain-containing protein [Gemmatimonadaceae bacterium]|nr:TonB-dependent receptor plug domain-containing protein [Gemmatimonadaceae bacterium]
MIFCSARRSARRTVCALALRVAPLAFAALPHATLTAQATPATPLDRRLSVQFRDVSLREALDRVMAVARVRISYSAELLPLDRSVRAAFDSTTVRAVLAELLRDVPVLPVVSGGTQIVLAPVRDVRVPAPPRLAVGTAELDRVVVTGTADGAPQRALPVSLAVLDSREATAAGLNDFAAMLAAGAPGIWAWEQSPSSLITRYGSVRGASSFGATYPKTYIDGIAVANPLLMTQFDPEGLERIEVIRGPQGAALYGADAISGVLNIVTRHDGVDAGAPRTRLRTSLGVSESEFAAGDVLAQDHRFALGLGSGLRTAQIGVGVGALGPFYTGAASQSVQASAGGSSGGVPFSPEPHAMPRGRWDPRSIPCWCRPPSRAVARLATSRCRDRRRGFTSTRSVRRSSTRRVIAGRTA